MATLSIANQWTASSGDKDHEILVTPTDGNWLIAAVALHRIDGQSCTISVGDLCRNLWYPLGHAENTDDGVITELWACPNVKTYGAGTRVYGAVSFLDSSDIASVPVNVTEVTGMDNGFLTIDTIVTNTADGTTNITLALPDPSHDCLMLASVALDVNFGSVNTTGTGWAALTPRVDANPNVGLAPAWAQGTDANNITVALLAGTGHWAGVAVALRKAGVAPSVSADWGNNVSMEVQLALGYDLSTPTSAMHWLTLSDKCQYVHTSRGIAAELGTVQTGESTVGWINDNGAFTPRDETSAVVSATSTVATAKVTDASASVFVVGDFFRLQSGSALLEDTVFQITSKTSSAGVTTLGFSPNAKTAPVIGNTVAGTPLDIFTPVRALATVDGKKYPVMVGRSEAIPQTWIDDKHGRVEMSAVDAYATLTATVPNVVDGQILAAQPVEYWRLDDPQGAVRATNSADESTTTLVQTTSKFGKGTNGVADFGAATQDVEFGGGPGQVSSLFGSSASGWGQSGLASGDTTKGFALVGNSDNFPSITHGVTITGISCLFSSQPTGDGTIFIIRNRDPAVGSASGSIIKLALDISARAAVVVWDKDTHASSRTLATNIIGNSGWISWAITFNRTSWTLYTAGIFTQSGSCDLVTDFTSIDIGGEADVSWNGHCVNAVHSRIAIYDRFLTPGEINQVNAAVQGGLSSVTNVDGTIKRQLAFTNWNGARALSQSDIPTSEDVGLEGSSVGEVVSNISTWEDGLLFVDAAGYLRYLSRDLLDRTDQKFVLGPNTAGGEVPYLGAPQYDADGRLLFTEIDIDNVARFGKYFVGSGVPIDLSGIVSAYHENTGKYGVRPQTVPTHLYDMADITGLGEWLVGRYGVRKLRVKQVQVDPRASAGTTGWHAILGAEVGDVIGVRWNPGNAPEIVTRCVVLSISHEADPSRWITTFSLMVAPERGIVLDDSEVGMIDEGTLTL